MGARFTAGAKKMHGRRARRFECHASLNAEGFYSALGFRSMGRIEVRIGPGPMLPCILMERAI
ncbi:hypothetical protein AJ88_30125 [Mesorhizobium amorphae CCBAU 01583]|nr:hypothetical protein AJ88_30125 [Mesorhizobium amorphae CCBAU 01583]